ncbi:MAG: O-antigen ligase family protein [Desulfobacterales bacterium]|nr:O-antigen ligase family protein [Desulfobacterales bacterium]
MMPKIPTLSNEKMKIERRLDDLVSVTGALIPVGLVVGNIGFETLIAASGLFWIGRCYVAKKNPLPDLIRHPLMLPWMIWFGCIVLSLILNGQGSKGWAHDVSFVRYPLFALAMIDTSRRRPVVRYCLFGLAAGVVLAAVNTLLAYVNGFDLLGKSLVRYTTKIGEAGRITTLSSYAAPFCLAWALMDTRLNPRAKWIITVIGLIAVAVTFKFRIRTAIIAMLAGIFPVLLYSVKKRFSSLSTMGIVVFLIACTVIIFYFQKIGNLNSLYHRFYIWKVSLAVWGDHPWVGVGVSSFKDAFTATSTPGSIAYLAPNGKLFDGSWAYNAYHAHNIFLMLMATTGILGLAVFGWLFANAVRMTFTNLDGWRWGLITWPIILFVFGLAGFNIYHSGYLSLVAYFLVLIGIRAHPDELSKFYST